MDPLLLALVALFARVIGATCEQVARHPHGAHHLATHRRGVDLRPVPPAPWVNR